MVLQLENPLALWGLAGVLALAFLMLWKGYQRPSSFSKAHTWLSLTALTLCILGLCRPQMGHHETINRGTNTNLFIAIDISRSMLAEDITPSRLRFSTAFAQKLISQLPGARVAIFPFSGDGYLQMPFTTDMGAVSDLLATMDTSMTTDQGTDLAYSLKTLFLTLSKMEDKTVKRGKSWASPQVILFSDGESHGSPAKSSLSLFKNKNIPIHTVGSGTKAGTRIHIRSPSQGVVRNMRSKLVHTKLNVENLTAISEATGGSFFASSFSEIDRAAQQISRHAQFGKLHIQFKADRELFPLIFAIALLLFCFELSLGRWHYAIRSIPFIFFALSLFPQLTYANPGNETLQLDANQDITKSDMDDNTKAIHLYNAGVSQLEKNSFKAAIELFQETVFLSTKPSVKKKALYNMGNAALKMRDPEQAIQLYQEAYDTLSDNETFEKEANQRISENIALAVKTQKQMQKGKSGKKEGKQGQGSEQEHRKGPQKHYEAQRFSEVQKQKMFDLIASEEQQILKRLRDKKRNKSGDQSEGNPW